MWVPGGKQLWGSYLEIAFLSIGNSNWNLINLIEQKALEMQGAECSSLGSELKLHYHLKLET